MSIFEITVGNSAPPPSLWATVLPGLFVALTGGVVLWALNWFREWITAKWNRHTEAEVLAFSLASELDWLISACYDVAHDPQEMDRQTGCWEYTVETPKLKWSENLKWSAFPRSLHYRIRALPNKIDAAIKSCAAEAEWGDGPPDYIDYFREREGRFSQIGLEACDLRQALADDYGVEMIHRGGWEPEEGFKAKIQTYTESKDKRDNAPESEFLRRKVPIEELEKRRTNLAAALEVAKAKVKARLT